MSWINVSYILSETSRLGVRLSGKSGRLQCIGPLERLPSELQSSIAASRDELLAILKFEEDMQCDKIISRRGELNPVPLTPSQSAYWRRAVASQLDAALNECIALQLSGPVDLAKVEWCWNRLYSRHEALRTRFLVAEEGVFQFFPVEQGIPVIFSEFHYQADIDSSIRDFCKIKINLLDEPPIRLGLFCCRNALYILVIVIHHLVIDLVSTQILLREFEQLYLTDELPHPPSLQFGDYAHWMAYGKVYGVGAGYWSERMQGIRQTIFSRPSDPLADRAVTADISAFNLSPAQQLVLQQTAVREGLTLPTILLAAFLRILAVVTQAPVVVVGMTVSARFHEQLADSVGYYLDVVPVVVARERLDSVRGSLKATSEAILNCLDPRNLICFAPGKFTADRPEWRSVMFNFVDETDRSMTYQTTECVDRLYRHYPLVAEHSKITSDVSLSFFKTRDGLFGLFRTNQLKCGRGSAARWQSHYLTLLSALIDV